MARHVDRNDLWKAEVPDQVWNDKGSDKAARCGVDVDRAIDVAFNEEVVDGFDVFVFTGIGGADNGADADCVFIDEVDGFFGVDYITLWGAVDILVL